jgi:hypothetical protein
MCFIKHYVPYIFCLLVQLILRRLQLRLIFSSLAFLLRTPHKNVVKKLRWADQNLILFWDIILFFGKSYPRGRAARIARDRWQSDPLCAFFLARAVRSLPCPSQSRGRGRVRVHVHGGGRGRVQGGWCEEAAGPHRLTGR